MFYVIWLLATMAEYLVIATILDCFWEGVPRFRWGRETPPEEYLIRKENRMDLQSGPSCSGYAAAYVLRNLGIPARGEELYQRMPSKTKKGAVHPKGLVRLLNRELEKAGSSDGKRYRAEYCRGNLQQLKREVSQGVPVIAYIKTYPGKHWLHFIPVVGYDGEYIYLAESMENNRNDRNLYYNRKVPVTEFQRLWNTVSWEMPLVRNTYIAVRSLP